MAKIEKTVVDCVDRASVSTETISTLTHEAAVGVGASGTIGAWIGETLVNILFAHQPSETRSADTLHFSVLLTRCSVETGLGVTQVSVDLTPLPSKPRVACTREVCHCIYARAIVPARIWGTVVDIDLTLQSGETISTQALKTVDTIHTHPTIRTREAVALLHIDPAVGACKPSKTVTCEVSSLEREAGAIVSTRIQYTGVKVFAKLTCEL